MITHYIIMSSSYSNGSRIALDYSIEDITELADIRDTFNKIINQCGKDVSVSTHFIQTNSKDWNSVIEKDYFFKDVEVIESTEKFIELINKDRVLNGLDVAKYILCKIGTCTHLKLEKLVYLCFADYLCKYDKPLFKDKIYAYKLGPVVKSVYKKYKKQGYRQIEKDDEDIKSSSGLELPSRSRILFAEDGVEKVLSIEETIEKYGKYSASDLVEITHRDFTPWFVAGKGENFGQIIDIKIIKEFHCNEF